MVKFPSLSLNLSFNSELSENLIPAFGILPIRVGKSPLYRLMKPVVWTVCRKPETMPVYGSEPFGESCSCVLMNSIGQTAVASIAPAIHPAARGMNGLFFLGTSDMIVITICFDYVLNSVTVLLSRESILKMLSNCQSIDQPKS